MRMNLVRDEFTLTMTCVSPCSREDCDTRAVSESYPLMLRGREKIKKKNLMMKIYFLEGGMEKKKNIAGLEIPRHVHCKWFLLLLNFFGLI